MDRRTFLSFLAFYAAGIHSKEHQSRTLAKQMLSTERGRYGQMVVSSTYSTSGSIHIPSVYLSTFWREFGIEHSRSSLYIRVRMDSLTPSEDVLTVSFGHHQTPFLVLEDRGLDDRVDSMRLAPSHVNKKKEPTYKTSVFEHRQLAYRETLDMLASRYQK